MNKSHKISLFILAAIMVLCVCTASVLVGCGEKEHTHSYSSAWSYDESEHWHDCTYDGCDETSDRASHTFNDGVEDADGNITYTCTECGYQQTSTYEIYSVTITNMGGTGASGVSVQLWTATGTYITSGTTSSNGSVRFRNIESGTYYAYIDLSTLPEGYVAPDGYTLEDKEYPVMLTASDKRVTCTFETAVITDTEMPSSKIYYAGDTMYDFTFEATTVDGGHYDINLATYLQTYSAVIINFFYTTCSPCVAELDYMQNAYDDYGSKVALIGICITSTGDTESTMMTFMKNYNVTYDFVYDSQGFFNRFVSTSTPTTVVVDRYGCIAEIEIGSNVSQSYWNNLFVYYSSDDYAPTYGSSYQNDDSAQIEADVEMPSSEEIAAAIVTANDYTTSSTFTFSNYSEDGVEDVYNWPWIIGESSFMGVASGKYIQTSNYHVVGGYSIIVIDVSLTAGQTVLFDYYVSTEEDYDIFYVQVDTVLQSLDSGDSGSWQTCLAYVAKYSGDYQITLYYQKDSSKSLNNDTVYVSNLRIVSSADLAGTTLSADLLYNAATNYTTLDTVNGISSSEYGEVNGTNTYGYINYVSVYLASDGYYHVGDKEDGSDPEDDPYLLADLYYGTPWYSTMSVWYEVYAIGTDINTTLAGCTSYGTVYDAFEDYTWAQNNNPWGYVPVNEELHDMLVAFVAEYGRQANSLDNQWLELCRYYVHYGAEHTDDKCYSVKNIAETYGMRLAKDLGEISATTSYSHETATKFTVEVEVTLVPRGQYYKFTVDKSGVYRIYSYDFVTDSDALPYGFIMDENGNSLGSATSDDLADEEGFRRDNYDASALAYEYALYVYLTAGETYYLGTTFDSTEELGTFDVGIYYLGEELSYFTTLATGSYYTYYEGTSSSGETTYTYYLPTRLSRTSYAVNPADGIWYTLDENGDYDQMIYIDMVGTTWFNYYSSYTIETAIEANPVISEATYDDDGNLLTAEVRTWNTAQLLKLEAYLAQAKANTGTIVGSNTTYSLAGCLPAYEDLATYINILCNGGDDESSATFAENAWMLTAYYLRIVSND